MEKMLVIVVDGSIKLARYWDDIKTILESIIRKFCASHESTSSNLFGGRYNLNLVINAAEDGSIAQFAPQYDWPQSVDSFIDSLSRLNFNKYGYLGNSGVIEGISKALMMFPSTRKRTKTQLMGKRHCVLVTASHPYPCPKEVLIPTNQILDSGEVVEVTIENVLADAETMARSLAESFISLSVICPSDMPMIRTIYDAGNQNPGPFTERLKHPHLLLLISEQFSEAREALKQFEAENNNDTNLQQDPLHLIAKRFSDEEVMLLQNLMEQRDDTIPIATEEEINGLLIDPDLEGNIFEETSIKDVTDARWQLGAKSYITDVIMYNNSTTQQGGNSAMQGSSSKYFHDDVAGRSILITPKEKLNNCFGKFTEMPILEGTATDSANQPCQRTTPKANNNFHFPTSWLEKYDPSQVLQASDSRVMEAVNISQNPEGETHNHSMLNFQHKVGQVASLHNAGSGTNTSLSVFGLPSSSACPVGSSGVLNPKMPLYRSRVTSPSMGASSSKNVSSNNKQLTCNNASGTKYVSSTNAQTASNNTCLTRDVVLRTKAPISGMNTSGTGNVINTPIAAMNTYAANDALPSSSSYSKEPKFFGAAPLPSLKNVIIPNAQSSKQNQPRNNLSSEAPSGYIKAWEGSLTSRGSGVALFVSKVVAYRKPTVPEKIFENWPKVIQMNHLVSLAHISTSPIRANRHYLSFSVLDSCPTWDHMESKNLCAYINLPGHTLILWILANKTRLMGMLCEGIIPVYSHQIFRPNW